MASEAPDFFPVDKLFVKSPCVKDASWRSWMNTAGGKGILESEVNREGQRGRATKDDELWGMVVLICCPLLCFSLWVEGWQESRGVSSEGFTLKLVTVWQVSTLLTSAFHEITTCFLPSLRMLLLTTAVSVELEIKNLSKLSPALLKSQILELQKN